MPDWYKTAAEVEAERREREAAQVERARAQAYRDEADPLFFKWQRGEATESDWLGKVAEIRERHPKPAASEKSRKP